MTFTANWDRDVRAERKAAFNQFWRTYNSRFYDPNFHGRDWAAIKKRYEPLLDGVGTRDEFATLLPGTSAAEADAVGRRLGEGVFVFNESNRTTLRFSAGWAVAERLESWDAALERADAMLYRQKRALR